jgi:zinc protease
MMLLKNLLAGQGGLLFREMREKQGLGYAVTPMLWRTKPAGFLAFYIGTEPDKAATALDSFHALTEQLRSNAIDPEEVRRAQQLLQTEYFRDRQSLASRSSEAADLLTYGFDLNFHKSMIDEALGLSAADLSSLAAQYLDLSSAYTITVSPSQED